MALFSFGNKLNGLPPGRHDFSRGDDGSSALPERFLRTSSASLLLGSSLTASYVGGEAAVEVRGGVVPRRNLTLSHSLSLSLTPRHPDNKIVSSGSLLQARVHFSCSFSVSIPLAALALSFCPFVSPSRALASAVLPLGRRRRPLYAAYPSTPNIDWRQNPSSGYG